MEFLCELYDAPASLLRAELTSELNSRMRCVAKVVVMLWTRTAVADLCMFGLAACVEGGPCKCANDHQRETSQLECGFEVNAQALIDTLVLTRTTQSKN